MHVLLNFLFGRSLNQRMYPVIWIVLLALLVSGCQVELYSKLEEQEGNEMLALLLSHDISSSKKTEKDSMISLYVQRNHISEAVELLRKNGYPKNKFSTIGDVFSKDKLISTPFEDRTRYVYGLSQEIAETLSQVDGVMTARVHVVLPDEKDTKNEQASAAVFIKHNPNYDFDAYIPQIKSIVSSGIAGLPYNAVTVALFPAQQEDVVRLDKQNGTKSIFSIEVAPGSIERFYLLLAGLVGLVLFSMLFNVVLLTRGKRSVPNKHPVADS